MNKPELKKNLWENIKPQIIAEIGKKYELSVEGLDNESDYFHPVVKLSEFEYLRAQGDIKQAKYYAVYLHPTKKIDKYTNIEIELQTSSFKDAISLVKRKKLSSSIKDTFQEIEVLKKSIEHMNDLIDAKTKLLKSIVVRH